MRLPPIVQSKEKNRQTLPENAGSSQTLAPSFTDGRIEAGTNQQLAHCMRESPRTVRQNKNRAAIAVPSPVVQGYFTVAPAHISTQNTASVTTREMARTPYGSTYTSKTYTASAGGANPTADVRTTASAAGTHATAPGRLPSFRVSEHGELALPASGQAANFYGTADTVRTANTALRAGGAQARLASEGLGIAVPTDPSAPLTSPTHTLEKIHAATMVPDGDGVARIQVAQTLPEVECNNFIRLITGVTARASRVAVLENSNVPDSLETEVPAAEGSEPVLGISRHITRAKAPSPAEVGSRLKDARLNNDDRTAGKSAYEQLAPAAASSRAARIGINEHALPEVGEGLVIRSMSTDSLDAAEATAPTSPGIRNGADNNRLTRLKMRKSYQATLRELRAAEAAGTALRSNFNARVQRLLPTWREHYAGVVARDGSDYVTLENYNRRVEVQWEYRRIFNQLFEDFDEFRTLVSHRLEHLNAAPTAATIQRLVRLAAEAPRLGDAYRRALEQATASFQTGLNQVRATTRDNFYFAMYGPGGQSFHSAFAPVTSNPMTLRIRESMGPVQEEATQKVDSLNRRIRDFRASILAYPTGKPAVHGHLLNDLAEARLSYQQIRARLNAASNRGAYKAVFIQATQTYNNLGQNLIRHLSGCYQTVTGTAPAPQPTTLAELATQTDAYVTSYYWFQRTGARYTSIQALQALLQSLTSIQA